MRTGPRARFIHRLTGQLEVISPLHVGTGVPGPGVDDTLQTDGTGALVIPGTALAGALRARIPAYLTNRLQERAGRSDRGSGGAGLDKEVADVLGRLFGADALDATAPASRVLVEDAPLIASPLPPITVWHGVGISAHSGVAEPGVLYTRELVEPGASFELSIEIEDGSAPGRDGLPDSDERWLACTMTSLLMSGLSLGRSTSTGLGQVRLRRPTLSCSYDLTTRDGMLRELAGEAQRITVTPTQTGSVAATEVLFTIDWEPTGTIMCGVETEGSVSLIPRTLRSHAADGVTVRPVLPGAGIKGALRKRAELIARTVASTPEDTARSRGTLLADSQDERLGAVLPLFGRPAKETVDEDGKPEQQGVKAALTVNTCTGTFAIPDDRWAPVLAALPTRPTTADGVEAAKEQARKGLRSEVHGLNAWLTTQHQPLQFDVVDRVAIDRWTQGAATSRLFAALEPTASAWEPIQLRLDLSRTTDPIARQDMIALMLLVLRDTARGWVPLGRGTRRGWGAVRVTRVTCTVGAVLRDVADLQGVIPMPSDTAAPGRDEQSLLIESLVSGWFTRQSGRRGEAQ